MKNNISISGISSEIKNLSRKLGKKIRIMHICGTHEHTISRYNLRSMLPSNINVIAGPGCPVCVCPEGDIDDMVFLAEKGYHILSFGDMMRVPSSSLSLQQLKGEGYNISIILGPQDAVNIAKQHPENKYVFFCVGFETTAGPISGTIITEQPGNLYYYLSLRYVPKAVDILLSQEKIDIDAVIIPGHASIMSGLQPYEEISRKYSLPSCVAGFEPENVLLSILYLLRSLSNNAIKLDNVYKMAVKYNGNQKAIGIIYKVFHRLETLWRGLGKLPDTGFFFNSDFQHLHIAGYENMPIMKRSNSKGDENCLCSEIILGRRKPDECPLFAKLCRPDNPVGPCMVSLEGSCRIFYKYRGKDR